MTVLRPATLATALALTVLLTACPPTSPGGDGDGATATQAGDGGAGSADDFIAAADAICLDAEQQVHEIVEEFGAVASPEDDAAVLEDTIPVREAEVEALAELDVPEELADRFEEYLDGRRTVNATSAERQAAGEEGDQDENLEAAERSVEERREANEIAAEIGLTTCAHVLPEDEAPDVTELAEIFFTAEDEACAEHLTEEFIEAIGGVERCEGIRDVERAESVDVEVIDGVSEIRAAVRAVLEGGDNDGGEREVILTHTDDGWKIDGILIIR